MGRAEHTSSTDDSCSTGDDHSTRDNRSIEIQREPRRQNSTVGHAGQRRRPRPNGANPNPSSHKQSAQHCTEGHDKCRQSFRSAAPKNSHNNAIRTSYPTRNPRKPRKSVCDLAHNYNPISSTPASKTCFRRTQTDQASETSNPSSTCSDCHKTSANLHRFVFVCELVC
jgi:hypothetical protein